MGKSTRDSDPFVLDDHDQVQRRPKARTGPQKEESDPFVLDDQDKSLVKKKAGGTDSATTSSPGPSELQSADDINSASKAYQDKSLTVKDQDVLANTDWGKQEGLGMPDIWKGVFVQAHNGPKTSELVNSVMNVLNQNYPRSDPASPQSKTREQIFSSVQQGDVPAIQKVRNSIIDSKQQEIMKIQQKPEGPEVASNIIGAPAYAVQSSTIRSLSDEQKRQVTVLQDEIARSKSALDAFTAHAIVSKAENQMQIKAELSPQNSKFADLTLSAQSVGQEMERTIGINKTIPNNKYEQTRAGLEAIMSSYQMDINDLMTSGMKSKNPDLLKKATDKIQELNVLQSRYNNLDNQFPDVGTYKTARYLGDIMAETHPHRLLTTSADVQEAAAIAEKRNPGFLQSHGKFVETVAKSEGDWIGVKAGLVPQGGVIGGVKAGATGIGFGGASFVASPFGRTWDPRTLENIQEAQAAPQLQGTSTAGVQPTKIVYDKENKAYREITNENYGNWNYNSAMYSLGKAVPTLAQWVVLDKGIGGAAKGLGGLAIKGANAISKDLTLTTNALIGAKDLTSGYEAMKLGKNFEKAAGLYGTTYVTSFDENRKLADGLIEDKTSMGEAKKNVLANFLTLSTAGIFSMMDYSPTKAVEAALTKSAAPEVMKFLEKANWENLSQEQTAKLLKEQIWPRVKAVVRAGGENALSGAKLGAAGVVDQKIKDFAGLIVNPDKAKYSDLEENAHSFVDQVVLMTAVGLPGMVRSGIFPHSSKDALYQAGLLAPQYIDRINERAASGDLDQAQANQMIGIVKTMAEEVDKARSTTTKDGTPLTVQQKREIAVNSFRKRAATMLGEMKVPVQEGAIHSEADKAIDQVREENKWNNIEDAVPFQTARDAETGKKLPSVNDIDPKKQYTYEKDGETVTASGAELFDHLINGEYEQADKGKNADHAEGKEGEAAGTEKTGEVPEGETGQDKEDVAPDELGQGRQAIEKAIEDGKLKGPYAALARTEPAMFLKEIAEQARGVLSTGDPVQGEGVGGEDAGLAVREEYGSELVDAALALHPKEEKGPPPTTVIRHAESKANADKKLSVDETPLTVTGETQAGKLGDQLSEQGYTDVLPSATTRAEQTAQKVIEKTGGKLLDHPELSKLLKEWDQSGGESIDDFAKRVAKAREGIAELPEGTAVIAHGKVMGMLEALDKADGDIEKAKELFDQTKVYGNTDAYIPSSKTKNNEQHQKGNARKGNQKGRQSGPETRQKGNGQPTAGGEEGSVNGDVHQAAQAEHGEGGQETQRHHVDVTGAAGEDPAAPSRQSRINDLVAKTNTFNKLRSNDPAKSVLLNEIRLASHELGLKVDYGKGFATIKDQQGNKVQRRSEETNQTKAKDFDLSAYSKQTKGMVHDLVAAQVPLTSLAIPGFDGRMMSEAQKETALDDIRKGNITNGAKAIYDAMERVTSEGFVEVLDPSTRKKIGIPLDVYLQAVKTELKPITDDEIVELNTLLGQDVFGKIFDDIFAETTQSPVSEQPERENTEPEQPPAGGTSVGEAAPGSGETNPPPSEPPAAQPEAQAEVAEEKVTGIRNIVVNTERMDRSLDPVVKEAATNFKDNWNVALSLVRGGNVDPRSLVSSLAGKDKPLVSDIDNALILMDRIDLTNQRIDLTAAIEKAMGAGDEVAALYLNQRLDDVDQKISQNDEVADRTGQETARALSSRRMLATLDYTLSKMTADIRRLYDNGDIPDSVTERLRRIEKDHADLLRKYAEREEQWRRGQAEKVFAQEKVRVSKTETKEKPEKTIALKGKALADRLRSLRPKTGGTAQSNLFGLPIAIYDTAIVTIANLVEGGAKLADAMNEAFKDLAFPSDKDRKAFEEHITGFVDEENDKALKAQDARVNLVNTIVANAKDKNAAGIVKDSITPLRKLASHYIKEGSESLDDLVDKIHGDLVDQLPEISKREIRDAFSGYGDVRLETRNDLARQVKELQKQATLVSQMEDALTGERPERGGRKVSEPSKAVVQLRKELEKVMKDNGMTWEEPPRNKEQQAQRALQSAKNRLTTQIDQLSHQLRTGEMPPERERTPWDAERVRLKQNVDLLKGLLAETEGPSQLSDAMRVRRLENSLKKQIGQYQERIDRGGAPLRVKSTQPSTPEIESLRKSRDELREINRKLQVDNSPKSSPQQIALEAYKDRVSSRIKTLALRTMEGDFEPKERVSFKKDADALKLDLALKKTESQFFTLKRNAEKENRGRLQKIFDKITAYKRFAVLSGLPSLGKIGLAVTYRTIGTPAEELVGSVIRHIPGVRQVADQAPREGRGFTFKQEGAALSEWVKAKTYSDFLEVLKHGKGELDTRMGKYAEDNPELIEIFGRIHASLKNFSKRAEFARSYEARMEFARKKGFDTSDELVQMTSMFDAYTDASRAIFMQENVLTKEYFKLLKKLEGDGSGWLPRVAAFLARFTMPVVKVPTNFIAETGTFAFGAFTGTAQILNNAFRGQLTKLTPHDADLILRSLKKGSVGLTLGIIGYMMPQLAGGYWQRGDKRDEDDVQPGELMFFGVRIPKWATHFPALEVMQMGATLRRAYDRRMDESDNQAKAVSGSIFDAVGGLLGEVPLFDQPTQLMSRVKNGEWDRMVGDEAKGLDPQLIQNIASWSDREDGAAVKRAPENLLQTVETGIPGLRSTVPRK